MLCLQGRIALSSFTAFAVLALYQVKIITGDYWSYKYSAVVCISAVLCVFVLPYADTIKRAAVLGSLFGGSLFLSNITTCPWNVFCVYFVFLTAFHFSEYMLTALYNSKSLSTDSFLLNHSTEYVAAAVTSWLEFTIESYFFPSMKCFNVLTFLGVALVIFGETVRKGAMITAGSNFNHIVQSDRKSDHMLVTHGLYKWSRHPSYVGWFYWSIGTQVLLANPLCTVAYAVASWKFFNERVKDEEMYLIHFFEQQYIDYIMEVPTRLPFINGMQDYVNLLQKDE